MKERNGHRPTCTHSQKKAQNNSRKPYSGSQIQKSFSQHCISSLRLSVSLLSEILGQHWPAIWSISSRHYHNDSPLIWGFLVSKTPSVNGKHSRIKLGISSMLSLQALIQILSSVNSYASVVFSSKFSLHTYWVLYGSSNMKKCRSIFLSSKKALLLSFTEMCR